MNESVALPQNAVWDNEPDTLVATALSGATQHHINHYTSVAPFMDAPAASVLARALAEDTLLLYACVIRVAASLDSSSAAARRSNFLHLFIDLSSVVSIMGTSGASALARALAGKSCSSQCASYALVSEPRVYDRAIVIPYAFRIGFVFAARVSCALAIVAACPTTLVPISATPTSIAAASRLLLDLLRPAASGNSSRTAHDPFPQHSDVR